MNVVKNYDNNIDFRYEIRLKKNEDEFKKPEFCRKHMFDADSVSAYKNIIRERKEKRQTQPKKSVSNVKKRKKCVSVSRLWFQC